MRRTTTLTALALGAALLAPTGSATAVGETCRGEAATIVGTSPDVVGTDGRDVIVTGKSTEVLSGAGDDVICVTGKGANTNSVTVFADAGNDIVDSTAMPRSFYLTAILGDGADTFVGGAGSDSVVAGTAVSPEGAVPSEGERDVIDTGDGDDSVASGGPGLANDDEVRTGNGRDDITWSGTMGPTGVLDAGNGEDQLIARASGQTFGIDLAAMTLTRNGMREGTFTSIEWLSVVPEPELGTLSVHGTDGDDTVAITDRADVRVELGAGDDELELAQTSPESSVDLGRGTDRLTVRSTQGSVVLDLAHGSLMVDDSPGGSVLGVEDSTVSAEVVTVTGNARANTLFVTGCVAVVDGRGGRDSIEHSNYDVDLDTGYDCDSGSTSLRGGSGNDRIYGGTRADRIYGGRGDDRIEPGPAGRGRNKAWGGPGDDKLIGAGAKDVFSGGSGNDKIKGGNDNDALFGGSGKDLVVGGPGRDACVAEVERSCEGRR